MAEHGAEYHRGEMDIQEHTSTFSGFVKMTKWGSLYIGALLLLLTLWFCTPTGAIGALIAAAVMVALGTLVLGEKRKL
jgi:hypothetical protein